MNGQSIPESLLPLIGHWTPDIVLLRDGSLMATRALSGVDGDLSGETFLRGTVGVDSALLRSINDGRVEVWDHFVRQGGQDVAQLDPAGNWLAERFDEAHRLAVGQRSLMRNDLFTTIIMRPSRGPDATLSDLGTALLRIGRKPTGFVRPRDRAVQEFQLLLTRIDAALARYGAQPLGIQEEKGFAFSEIAEAMHLIMNGHYRKIGVSALGMASTCVPDRSIHGHDVFELKGAGSRRLFGSMLSFLTYPAMTSPTMFRGIKSLPFPLVMTSAVRSRRRSEVIKRIGNKRKLMATAADEASSQQEELREDADILRSGRDTFVDHHWSIAVYGETVEEVDYRAGVVTQTLSDVGVNAVRETLGLLPTYWAQMPGNWQWAPRSAPVKTINAAAFAARLDVPKGEARGRWGAPALILRTRDNTQFALHLHEQETPGLPAGDVGNMLVVGPAGSGKTALLGGLALGTLRNPHARVMVIDKDYGLANLVRGAGGSYLAFDRGQPTNLAPLRALTASPGDLDFLHSLLRGLAMVETPNLPIDDDDDRQLRTQLEAQMRMPADSRSIAGVIVSLDHKRINGIGRRLRVWGAGERLGHVFDNDRDLVDMRPRMVGFETGALLKDAAIAAPILAYLFHRSELLINGRPLLRIVDEMAWADANPEFRAMIDNALATERKREVVTILAGQSATKINNSQIASNLREQTPKKIFFANPNASREALCDGFGLTEEEYDTVRAELPGLSHHFLIKRPLNSVVASLDMSSMPGMVAVISGRESTYRLANELIAQHGAHPQAWVPEYEQLAPRMASDPSLVLSRPEFADA